jgi:hypothetical protein
MIFEPVDSSPILLLIYTHPRLEHCPEYGVQREPVAQADSR